MRDSALEEEFPGLRTGDYRITSEKDPNYNCIAWAVGDTSHFWYDVEVNGYYWPPGTPSADTLAGWVKVFQDLGYDDATDDSLDSDYEKVAIYISPEGFPEHVARQRVSGAWTSKMGKGRDIEHATLAALEGETMWRVAKIMQRKCKDGRRVRE